MLQVFGFELKIYEMLHQVSVKWISIKKYREPSVSNFNSSKFSNSLHSFHFHLFLLQRVKMISNLSFQNVVHIKQKQKNIKMHIILRCEFHCFVFNTQNFFSFIAWIDKKIIGNGRKKFFFTFFLNDILSHFIREEFNEYCIVL